MAGSLILLDSVTASDDGTVTLGTTDWDNSYNVYMVVINDVTPATDDVRLYMRCTKTSDNSVDDSSNYDFAEMTIKTYSAFEENAQDSDDAWILMAQEIGTGTSETANGVMYLFNFNNASEYSSITMEMTCFDDSGHLHGSQGAGALTVAQATNGVQFYMGSGNIASGEFKLYGLKK